MLNEKYVTWYAEVHKFYKQIVHGEIKEVNGIQVDELQRRAEEFINIMAQTIRNIT
jgi:hypothetical protein